MSIFRAREVERALVRKGFVRDDSNKHHTYFVFAPGGRETSVATHMSRNGQDVNAYLQKRMAKEMGMTGRDFENFVRCTLTEDGLLKLLRERGIVGR